MSSFIYLPEEGGKEKDGVAIYYHHNNVIMGAARCDIGMMVGEGCACAYLDAR